MQPLKNFFSFFKSFGKTNRRRTRHHNDHTKMNKTRSKRNFNKRKFNKSKFNLGNPKMNKYKMRGG